MTRPIADLSRASSFRGAGGRGIIRSPKGERSMAKRDGRIDSVFADMNVPQRPGAALLVIDHDEIVYSKCYGLADLGTQRPITTDTSFYLASISKQFTAMAIMMLAERGKLSFDDHLPSYFPRFPACAAGDDRRNCLRSILRQLPESQRFQSARHEE